MSNPLFVSSLLSPYGARVRLACALKGVEADFIPPPDGTGSPAYKKTNPYGRIPALVLDGGRELQGGEDIVAESLALIEYVEDTYPKQRRLRFDKPELTAKARMVALLFDHNVLPALGGVFKELIKPEPDVAAAQAAFDHVEDELKRLAYFFGDSEWAVGDHLSLADVALAPFAFLMDVLAAKFACTSPTQRNERIKLWWNAMQQTAEVQAVCATMKEGLAAMAAKK